VLSRDADRRWADQLAQRSPLDAVSTAAHRRTDLTATSTATRLPPGFLSASQQDAIKEPDSTHGWI
jgi:hypothetical protein